MNKGYLITNRNFFSPDANGLLLKVNVQKRYTKENVKSYFNWQHHLVNLSPISISLLFYLAERMHDSTNEVSHNKTIIRQYNDFRKSISVAVVSDSSIRKAFQQLKKNKMLISTPELGNYIVNPKFMYKESEEVRRKCINRLLECTKEGKWLKTNLFDALSL